MKLWDNSALGPLLVEEEVTAPLRDLYLDEPGAIVWCAAQREGFLVRDRSSFPSLG